MTRLRTVWRRLEPHAATRRGTTLVGLAALAAHSVLTVVFPAGGPRRSRARAARFRLRASATGSRVPAALRRGVDVAQLDRLNACVDGLRLAPPTVARAVRDAVREPREPDVSAHADHAVGVVATAVRRPARAWLLLTLLAVACAMLAATPLSVPPVQEFDAPFYPVVVLAGLAGLVGSRRDRDPGTEALRRP